MTIAVGATDEQSLQDDAADPVLAALAQTASTYKDARTGWERQAEEQRAELAKRDTELNQIKRALIAAEASVLRLSSDVYDRQRDIEVAKEETERQRRRAQRQQHRADKLAVLLKNIHHVSFRGDLYSMILQTCLALTDGTRGLYVTMRGEERRAQVRAAVGVDGSPQAAPSDFILALCNRVVDDKQTLVCDEADDLTAFGTPRAGEEFRNCVVSPVLLLKNFDGIMIVADRAEGDFDAEDVEALIAVGDQAGVAVQNMHLERELQRAYLSTVSVLADAVEAKDSYTQGHCEMVSRYARLTAERLDLSAHDRSIVCYAALLHDVGKLGVSDGILNKAGTLTPEERELVRSHVRVGHSLISNVEPLHEVARVVLHHHEWWNGMGYPDRLSGEVIPLASRIICVVDAYCAMITRRSYKEAFTTERARTELRTYAGSQFDPAVVDAFLQIIDLPEAEDQDDDFTVECGLMPTFAHLLAV